MRTRQRLARTRPSLGVDRGLAGLRVDELIQRYRRRHPSHRRRRCDPRPRQGKKDRRIPVEESLIRVLERYLDSHGVRFPGNMKRSAISFGIAASPATAALFVEQRQSANYPRRAAIPGAPGIQEGWLEQSTRGALVHGRRHTYATELANSDVSVYALMKLLGHESMVTSQRHVDGAGAENRAAAARSAVLTVAP
jgi:integrase/recombinase XerC